LGFTTKVVLKGRIPSGIHFLHNEPKSLARLVIAKRQIITFLNHGPVAAVIGEVEVAGVDVREAERGAAEIVRVIYAGNDAPSGRKAIDEIYVEILPLEAIAAEIAGAINVREEISAKVVLTGDGEVDGDVGPLDDVSADCSVCHGSLKVKCLDEKMKKTIGLSHNVAGTHGHRHGHAGVHRHGADRQSVIAQGDRIVGRDRLAELLDWSLGRCPR
jgi:hypothetical protein